MTTPTAIVHYNIDGEPTFLFCGDVEFLVIDERAPYDRVYQITNPVLRK